jgi:hypothetical protein
LEVESDLRVASDRILSSLDQLNALETEKRNLKPDSARFQTLAKEIERLAAEIFAQSHAQQRLGERAQEVAARTGAEPATINETQKARDISVILSEWRDAERRLQLAETDTAERALASADAARLREEYKAAYSAGLDAKRAD